MSKVRGLATNNGWIFFCPGCKSPHSVNTVLDGPVWLFNGDVDRPTFTPSILVTLRWSQIDDQEKDEVCHSFVTNGQIQFLGDCTHELANKIVDLPEWPYPPGTFGGIKEELK